MFRKRSPIRAAAATGMRMIEKKHGVLSLTLVVILLTVFFSGCARAEETNAENANADSVISFQTGDPSDQAPSSAVTTPTPTVSPQSSPDRGEQDTGIAVEIVFEQAVTTIETPLLRDLSDYEIVEIYPAGSVFFIMEYETPLWVYVQSEDGNEGFLYSDDLNALDENGNASAQPLGQVQIALRLQELQALFPAGYYWNHIGYDEEESGDYSEYISGFPCDHNVTGTFYCNHYNGATVLHYPEYGDLYQCLGFASFVSDKVFGEETDISIYHNYEYLQLGDHIRLHDYEHSMIIISIGDDAVTLGEVNENYNDCAISWERQITYSELQSLSWDSEYITRYPTFRDDAGNLLTDGIYLNVLADITV